MSKIRRYHCDGGCLMLGNSSFRVKVPNGYGDGEHRVVVESKKDRTFQRPDPCWKYVCSVCGDSINIYKHDCMHEDELADGVLFSIEGSYQVYVNYGDVLLREV